MKKPDRLLGVSLIVIFIATILISIVNQSLLIFPKINNERSAPIYGNWQVKVEGNPTTSNIKLPTRIFNATGKTITISRILRPTSFDSPNIMLRTSRQAVSVYINNDLIYNYDGKSAEGNLIGFGNLYHFVPYDKAFETSNSTIKIVYKSYSPFFSGELKPIYIGTKSAHLISIFKNEFAIILMDFIFLCLGLILLILFFFMPKEKKFKSSFLDFGLLQLAIAFWSITSHLTIIQALVPNPLILSNLSLLATCLMLFAINNFIVSQYGLKRTTLVHVALVLITFFYLASQISQMQNQFGNADLSLILINITTIAFYLLLLFELHLHSKRTNQDIKVVFISVSIVAAFAMIGFFGSLIFVNLNLSYITPAGYLAFTCITGYSLLYKLTAGEIKSAKNDLLFEQQRYTFMIENSDDVIFDLDIKANSMFWSPNTEKILGINIKNGISPEAFLTTIHSPENKQKVLALYSAIKKGTAPQNSKIDFVNSRGEKKSFKPEITIIFDEDGKPIHGLGIVKDLTSEISLEKEMEYREINFDNFVSIFEFDITNNTLIDEHARKELEAIGIFKSEFNTIIRDYANKLVDPDYIETFKNAFSVENILDKFNNNIFNYNYECPILNSYNRYEWVRFSARIFYSKVDEILKLIIYIKDIDKYKKRDNLLLSQAQRDPLTKLFNKTTTEDLINEYLGDLNNHNSMHAFLMIDIDNFKSINDSLGHAVGDIVISELASKLLNLFRADDIIGRIGGDEFVVLMKNINSKLDTVNKANEISDMFVNSFSSLSSSIGISASLGICLLPEDGLSYNDLYKKADAALYHSKDNGKNTYTFFDEKNMEVIAVSAPRDFDEASTNKYFKDNMSEYILKILYGSKDINLALNTVLELIGKHFEFCRASIFENSKDGSYISKTFEWCNKGIVPNMDQTIKIPVASLSNYYTHFNADSIYYEENINSLSKEIKQTLKMENVKTTFQCALIELGEFEGFISFDKCVKNKRITTEDDLEELNFISKVIATSLLKHRAETNSSKKVSAIINIIENMDGYAYIVDAETLDLLYVNKRLLALYPEVELGEKCYNSIIDEGEICSRFCPINDIKRSNGSQVSIKKYYKNLDAWWHSTATLIDWDNSKKAYLITAIDITDYVRKKKR